MLLRVLKKNNNKQNHHLIKKKMQRYVSFDVGIRNLAVCVINHYEKEQLCSIDHWDVMTLCKPDVPVKKTSLFELCVVLSNKLEQLEKQLDKEDIVLIENQPVLKNPTMKSIQIMIYMFFFHYFS